MMEQFLMIAVNASFSGSAWLWADGRRLLPGPHWAVAQFGVRRLPRTRAAPEWEYLRRSSAGTRSLAFALFCVFSVLFCSSCI